MAIDIKQQAKRFIEEIYGGGKLELINELVDEKYEGHDPVAGTLNREGIKQNVQTYRTAFPDLKFEITGIVLEGNTCVTCWTATGTHRGPLGSVKPTGKKVTVTGMAWAEYERGKVVRDYAEWDALGMFRQLGVEGGAVSPSAPEAKAPAAEARH